MARLFVGNLPYSATEADIQSFFVDAGFPVDSVDVMRDKFSGEARGFGFVEIADQGAAQRAVESCNGKALMGRNLVINEARPMGREGGGGGPRGPRGGGGGNRQRDFGGSPNRW
jgi:RNA recognition motif-containing protein